MSDVTDRCARSPPPSCRFCSAPLVHTLVDLGMSPLCESYVPPDRLGAMEAFYPLHVRVCRSCFLAQIEEFVPPGEIFTEYAYFSSYADSWVRHARDYAGMIAERLGLDRQSRVIEVASNDGYLLQHFAAMGIPSLGIEPAANVARAAEEKGVHTLVEFFGEELARRLAGEDRRADLLVGNNVLAQVPDLNDFVRGMKVLLEPEGVLTMEFPHLLRLMEGNQFDTIYHEHFSYFSFTTADRVFERHGLKLFDVEELPTHGGSLRIYGRHLEDAGRPVEAAALRLLEREREAGLTGLDAYHGFAGRVEETKRQILEFLIGAKREGRSVVGYGAPGKGNTLLNYCGIRTDFIDYTVDRNPYKQGKFLPGSRIPIHPPERIRETRPDYLFILPWNLKEEVMEQNRFIREWGGRFVVPIPKLEVHP